MKHIKLFEQFIGEGVNDPGILKAYFLAGGPGSGKSYVVNSVFAFDPKTPSSVSFTTGLKLINSDVAFEREMEKMGYEAAKLADYAGTDDWENVMKIRDKSKGITKRQMDQYIGGRLGMIIDGTGKDYNKITGWAKMLQDFGYDVHMVFVNTSLEVAQDRNLKRDRVLPEEMVAKMWHEVQDNLGKFQNFFKNKFFIVDNSGVGDGEALKDAEKVIIKSVKKPVENHIGKKWIKDMRNPGFNQPS